MKLLSLPSVPLAALQSLTERTIKIVTPITVVAPQLDVVKETLGKFEEAMIKESGASNKKTMDRKRDVLITGLMNNVNAEQAYPHAGEISIALDQVVAVVDKYGLALKRLLYDKQTAETDNLLAELEKLNLTNLESIARWIAPIQEANENFKLAAADYLGMKVDAAERTAAYLLSPSVEAALDDLFRMMFAQMLIAKTDDIERAYKELETLLDSFR